MEPFYRAKLSLEKVEPYIDGNYQRERTAEVSAHTVTGDTPGDAMQQIYQHAETLYDWHDDRTTPIVDEAVRFDSPLFDLSKVFRDVFSPPTPEAAAEQPAEPATDDENPASTEVSQPSKACGNVLPVPGVRPDHTCGLDHGHDGPHSSGDAKWDNDDGPDDLDRASAAAETPTRAQGGIITPLGPMVPRQPGGIVITSQPDPVETYRAVTAQIADEVRRQGRTTGLQ